MYITFPHQKVFANMKRPEKGFSGMVTPLFETMMVQATKDMGEDSVAPTDSYSTPIHTQPSSSKPQKKKSRRKPRKETSVLALELQNLLKLWRLRACKRRSKEFGKEKEVKNTRVHRMKERCVLEEQEKDVAEKEVSAADPVTTAGEVVTTANVEVTTTTKPMIQQKLLMK
ncbi:hypothetical protein Tco_0708325 [Tanacetum coccineum]